MDTEFNDKIKEIGSMFGIDNIPENIGDIVSSLLSDKDCNDKTSEINNEKCEQIMNDKETDDNSDKSANFDGILKNDNIIKIMSKMNEKNSKNKQDKKIKLLYAIEPFLSGKRKEKIGNCVKFLAFADIAKDLNLL